jgi:exodeoxyribonuclease-3
MWVTRLNPHRRPQVLDWLATQQPDALVLQEPKLVDDRFPHAELLAAASQAQYFGQPTCNGVALLSRVPAQDVQRNLPSLNDPHARLIAA